MDAQTQQLFQRLANAYGSIMRSPEARAVRQGTAIWNFMNEVGQVINMYSRMPQQEQQPQPQQGTATAAEDAGQLVALASWLDEAGAHAMADVMDEAARVVCGAVDLTPYPERPGTHDKSAQGHMRDALDAMEQARVLLVEEAFPSYSKAQTQGLQGEPWDAMEQDFHRLKRDLVALMGEIKDAFEQSGVGMGENADDSFDRTAASPYTHFYHFFYLVKSLFNSFQTVVMGADPKELDRKWLEDFGREWQRLLQRYSRFAESPEYKYSKKASLAGRLVAMAQAFDDCGEHVRADLMDAAADYVIRFAEDGEQEESPFKPMNETPLSTRYCPDHVGVQTVRISERAVQCPLDGRVYNYETGYTDYDGKKVPGGTVAAQTPSVMPYGIPNRVYDSRQSVINTMN